MSFFDEFLGMLPLGVKEISEERLQEMAARSSRNVHARGVDSIVFLWATGKIRLRAFIAHENHELWRNEVPLGEHKLSVGLHSHHCDVTLEVNHGRVFNVTSDPFGYPSHLMRFMYRSPITKSYGKFIPLMGEGYGIMVPLGMRRITSKLLMSASKVHTIFVPRGDSASWWVLEGDEDPDYTPITYSNDNLQDFDFTGMYQPMDVDYLRMCLDKMGIKVFQHA